MDPCQRVLLIDAGTGFYQIQRFPLGGLFGPVDLGLHLSGRYRSLNLGMCRFHRQWAEEILPEVMGSLYGARESYLEAVRLTASRIASRNAPVFWESRRNVEFVHTFLRRRREVEGDRDGDIERWLAAFDRDPGEAALDFWYETLKGIDESLREG